MFENCRLWNQKLDDRDEGLLPFDEWGALEDHLAHCTGCSQRLRANSAFRVEVETSVSDLSAEASNQFDDAVLSQINTEELAATVELKLRINFGGWLKDQLHRSTFAFLGAVDISLNVETKDGKHEVSWYLYLKCCQNFLAV